MQTHAHTHSLHLKLPSSLAPTKSGHLSTSTVTSSSWKAFKWIIEVSEEIFATFKELTAQHKSHSHTWSVATPYWPHLCMWPSFDFWTTCILTSFHKSDLVQCSEPSSQMTTFHSPYLSPTAVLLRKYSQDKPVFRALRTRGVSSV
jgi:hypothetical protein